MAPLFFLRFGLDPIGFPVLVEGMLLNVNALLLKRQFRPRCGIHGSWMIMVDQHPTNGLLGRKTESLLDSSLDKFHEAVKFQEKKADLSFGPQTK